MIIACFKTGVNKFRTHSHGRNRWNFRRDAFAGNRKKHAANEYNLFMKISKEGAEVWKRNTDFRADKGVRARKDAAERGILPS